MKETSRPCTSQAKNGKPEACEIGALDGRRNVESRDARIPKWNKRRINRRSRLPVSGTEFPPFQPAGLRTGGATAVIGLFEFTLRLRHDFARFR
jgi:hypothetical protein